MAPRIACGDDIVRVRLLGLIAFELPSLNVAVGYLDANDPALGARAWFDKLSAVLGTAIYNATGIPAISLPLAESTEGWPIGIQLAARNAEESTLLALAGDLERAMPWADRRPAVMAH